MNTPFWRSESFQPVGEPARMPDPRDPKHPTPEDADSAESTPRKTLHPPPSQERPIIVLQQGGNLIFQEESHPGDPPRATPGSPVATIASLEGSIRIGALDPPVPRAGDGASAGVGLGAGKNEDLAPNRMGEATEVRIHQTQNEAHCPISAGKDFFIQTDRAHRAFRRLAKPQWADAIGRDRFGLWTTIALEAEPETNPGDPNTGLEEPVTQRLRWIPPGQFIMGSPKSERAGFPKYEQDKWCVREAPRHQVILTQGYWLFDTPCTQALWQAVMEQNPSRFQSPNRPVESVTWNELAGFMQKINARIPELELTLPTEAQWEYACRAGIDAATYGGALELLGSNHAPVLDAIAWYGGNSGVRFELEDGSDSSGWREKQHDHTRAGTHPVAKKQANPWGLYDMLGNVWEWCRDGLREYSDGTVIDPVGSERPDAERAVRGGSWYYFARYVRAAFRLQYLPGVRFDRLGFRCVIGSQGKGP